MKTFLIAAALAALVAPAAQAAKPAKEPMIETTPENAAYLTVRQFIDGFNNGDVQSALAACAPTAQIIDEFPPYSWSGENACAVWANDYVADAAKKNLTDGVVTLHPAKHVFIDGDKAYVVAPTDYMYKVDGKMQGQMGSTLTAALQKIDGAWKITQWSWSQGDAHQ